MIPDGYEKLAVIGIAYKGDYDSTQGYKLLNAVYYEGATYVALKDNPAGPPVADNVNWQYMAKGFTEGVMSAINAVDTSALLGTAGETVGAQNLIDAIAAKVLQKLDSSRLVDNLLTTEAGFALDARMGKTLKDQLDQQNSDIGAIDVKTEWSQKTVALPYRPTTDGVLSLIFQANSGIGYCYISDGAGIVLAIADSTGGINTAMCPAIKGKTYSIQAESNAKSRTIRFTEFI